MEINKKIDVVFMGTVEFGAPLLEALAGDDRFRIPLVVTQEDRPAGRHLKTVAPLIKRVAERHGLPVFQPAHINDKQALEILKGHAPDFLLVLGYGQIFSQEVLDIPRHGCLNVHISLLPKYRGASPIQNALLKDETETGISLIQMTPQMDAGPVYKSFSLSIQQEDDQKTVAGQLGLLAAETIPSLLSKIAEGTITPVAQDEIKATYCKRISKQDGLIDWNKGAPHLFNEIRAYLGWPGSFTFFKGKQLKVLAGKVTSGATQNSPGYVFMNEGKVLVATGENALELVEVQLEGKKPVLIAEFIKGYSDFVGATLGNNA